MRQFRAYTPWQKHLLRDAAGGGGGGGGGSDGGALFGEIPSGQEVTAEQATQASEWLKSNTENFDPKSIEGKTPLELHNLARVGWTEVQKRADPFKGTPYEGQKVPDKFVEDKDGKKTVKAADILKGYTELERQQFRRREEVVAEARTQLEADRRKNAPAAPGDYVPGAKMKFGEREGVGVKVGDREVEIDNNDPALNFLKGVAHKYGVPQAEFTEMMTGYVAAMFAGGPKWSDEAVKLGGEAIAEKREKRADGFLRANLSAENYNFFARLPSTQRSIEAVEQLMTLSGHPAFVPDKGDIPGEVHTAAELREMQRDARYTGQGRPGGPEKAFVAIVRAGFSKLAKTK